jgi:putative glutamine amidotransferase
VKLELRIMRDRRPRIGVLGTDRQFDSAIGVTPHVAVRRQWIDRLAAVGGLPVILPPLIASPEEFLELVDAIVLPGGGDVDPRLYGQSPHPQTVVLDPARDEWEIEVVRSAAAEDLPILSICRGMQLLNVALGGTLIQHLPDQPHIQHDHENVNSWDRPTHLVHLERKSRVAEALIAKHSRGPQESTLLVNSIHHQAVADLGDRLVATGVSDDGVIESVESSGHRFVVGVQWHPELLSDPGQAHGLFSALVQSLA